MCIKERSPSISTQVVLVMNKYTRPSVHYGLRADILEKVIRKCLTLKIDFSANFNLTHDFFWEEALSTPQKLENAKMNLQISI